MQLKSTFVHCCSYICVLCLCYHTHNALCASMDQFQTTWQCVTVTETWKFTSKESEINLDTHPNLFFFFLCELCYRTELDWRLISEACIHLHAFASIDSNGPSIWVRFKWESNKWCVRDSRWVNESVNVAKHDLTGDWLCMWVCKCVIS